LKTAEEVIMPHYGHGVIELLLVFEEKWMPTTKKCWPRWLPFMK
jgi:hypothetical protein